jgi:hypothetical protein
VGYSKNTDEAFLFSKQQLFQVFYRKTVISLEKQLFQILFVEKQIINTVKSINRVVFTVKSIILIVYNAKLKVNKSKRDIYYRAFAF